MQRVALVTGAASGVGESVAHAFAREGWAVVLCDVAGERLGTVEKAIRETGGIALCLAFDVRDKRMTHENIRSAADQLGGFDALVPAAGISFPEQPFLETGETADDLIDVNLRGVIHVLLAALPHLRDGGSIVLAASTSGLMAHPGGAVYGATKLALVGLGRSLALEVADRGIRVNMVCPGAVNTPMIRNVWGDQAEQALAEYAQENPLGSYAEPGDVAEAVMFLTSSAARHVTGVSLRVDGGDCLRGAL
jgi:meso-butanediol dehydrogenase / (S,S)-butanediol dehydrogenase / diacetyl reductase